MIIKELKKLKSKYFVFPFDKLKKQIKANLRVALFICFEKIKPN